VDGSGRDGTEIDVMEKAWLLDQVQHTLHWDGYGTAHRSAEQLVTGRGVSDGGWHVFRVDWYPDEYVFFVDDRETWRTSAGGVCQTPSWILLTEEIGNFGTGPGQWGVGPIGDATLPDEFRVDYVRVSRYVPPPG
jgi:beta-glucanase (GH16 family)